MWKRLTLQLNMVDEADRTVTMQWRAICTAQSQMLAGAVALATASQCGEMLTAALIRCS